MNSNKNSATSLTFQLILISITLLITAYLFYKPLFKFNSLDLTPKVNTLDKDIKISSYDISIVNIGLFIYDFSKFDILKDEFTFDGTVFFEYDPTTLKLEDISKFAFKKGNILYKSDPHIRVDRNLVHVRYDIKVEFKAGLNYKLFPFSSHRINIILDNDFLYIEEMNFKSKISNFIVNPEIYISGWKEYNKDVVSGYYNTQFQKFDLRANIRHPRTCFVIEYLKDSTKEILSIFLPLFLLFFMAISSLGLNPEIYFHQIIGLSTGSLMGILSYKYVINNISPKVGYYMISDMIYFVFLVLIMFIFIVTCKIHELSKKQKIFISIFCNLIIILTFSYIFKYWSNL